MNVAFLDTVHPILSERLTVAGHRCLDLVGDDVEGLKRKFEEVEGIVVRGRVVLNEDILTHAPRLRFIARAGAGMENIDTAYCERRGIHLFNSPEGNSDALGEHAVGMLLALLNHLIRADREVRGGKWRRRENTGHELQGSTVGIIGFGRMGRAFAQKLAGFGVHLMAHDKYLRNYAPEGVREVELDDLFAHADVVSMHLPLTAETEHYADAAFFQRFAKPVRFINTARGPITDTGALLDAIDAGRVLGACLDVLEFEERSLLGLRPDAPKELLHRLYACDRVVLSPHVAGITHESYYKMANILADKILAHG